MPIQLPNDAKIVRQSVGPDYKVITIHSSEVLNFAGTEQDFLSAGYAYEYIQTDTHTRTVIARPNIDMILSK